MRSYLIKYEAQHESFGAWFARTMLLRAESPAKAFEQFEKEIAKKELTWARKVTIET